MEDKKRFIRDALQWNTLNDANRGILGNPQVGFKYSCPENHPPQCPMLTNQSDVQQF